MNKKILIISNPGEKDAENYCEGVNVDVREYISFFTSANGGAWNEDEIIILNKPTVSDLNKALYKLQNCEYSIIVFCGHGYYSLHNDSTFLELQTDIEYNSSLLRSNTSKRTIILDCCRKIYNDLPSTFDESHVLMNFSNTMTISKSVAREFYESELSKCHNAIILISSCSVDETAGDSSSKGGYYSYSLREVAKQWCRSSGTSKESLSVVTSHNSATSHVQQLTSNTQNPQIEKPRSMPYFPFAVK